MLFAELIAVLIGLGLGFTIINVAWYGIGFRNVEMLYASLFATFTGLIPFFLLVTLRGK